MEEKKEDYNLFNGRRSADQYVKGYLKAVFGISASGLAMILAFGGWALLQILELDKRVTTIEASRFTISDGSKQLQMITENKYAFSRIEQKLETISEDMEEFKDLMKRKVPNA